MKRLTAALLTGAAFALSACGNGNSGASNLSTSSVLGEAPPAASGERPGVKQGDPNARPIQVAWTSARAEKCGFRFDAARLKSNYLAFEQQSGSDVARLANISGVYDQTSTKVKSSIGSADTYCTDQKSTEIKADLTRHLAGNYEPKFEKQAESGGVFGFLAEKQPEEKFDPKTIWQDIQDKKNGVRRAKVD